MSGSCWALEPSQFLIARASPCPLSTGDVGVLAKPVTRKGVLGRAGKLDRNAGGDNAFEFHANLVDMNGGASLVIDTNDGVRVDILGIANEFAQK
jgi:hypothetical protein